jgi:hypothetical protein
MLTFETNELTLFVEPGQLTAEALQAAIELAHKQIQIWNLVVICTPEDAESELFKNWQVAGTTQDAKNQYRTLLRLSIRRSNDGKAAGLNALTATHKTGTA